MQKVTFAAGCFLGVQEVFDSLLGVISTRVGYTGGHTKNPTYKQVCTGTTGHAEAVEIIYDATQISYQKLLTLFWTCHNPTSHNRQGLDGGSQYRSAIFYHTIVQQTQALASVPILNKPVVTQIVPATPFYEAEEYHQHYLIKNKGAYCPTQ